MKGNNERGDYDEHDDNNQSFQTYSCTSPLRKKQCRMMSSSSSKPDNEGLHGSEPDLVGESLGTCSKDVTAQKQGVGETKKQPLGVVYDQTAEETYSDYESGDEGLDHYDEDHCFTEYDRLRDDRKIYLICLEEKIRSKSECMEYLKKICRCCSESHFLGGSKDSPYWFYARLTDNEAEMLEREGGVSSLTCNFFIDCV